MSISTSFDFDDELYKQTETMAKVESRTPHLQIQYWAKTGKTALDNPELPIEFIKSILISKDQPSEPFEFRQKRV